MDLASLVEILKVLPSSAITAIVVAFLFLNNNKTKKVSEDKVEEKWKLETDKRLKKLEDKYSSYQTEFSWIKAALVRLENILLNGKKD